MNPKHRLEADATFLAFVRFVLRSLMQKIVILLLVILPLRSAFALSDLAISTTPRMSWDYNMTQELGKGVSFSDLKLDVDRKFRAAVAYRLDGTEKVDGKDLLKFEMHRAGVVTNTDPIKPAAPVTKMLVIAIWKSPGAGIFFAACGCSVKLFLGDNESKSPA
jgi:hypothetical protein